MTALLQVLSEAGVFLKGDFLLHSGEHSSYYCNVKKAFGYPQVLARLVEELSKQAGKDVTCIVGSGYGGIALAAGVALKLNKPLTLVRDSLKDHGTRSAVEGYIPTADDRLCVVDDVYTTGGSIMDTIEKLKFTKATVSGALVVIARKEPSLTIPVVSLISAHELSLL